jgi:RAB protein geranylgeranyltransferase component A
MAGDESLAESILAAALARAGKTVLHLDHVSALQHK